MNWVAALLRATGVAELRDTPSAVARHWRRRGAGARFRIAARSVVLKIRCAEWTGSTRRGGLISCNGFGVATIC
jgi:hypothetical protein